MKPPPLFSYDADACITTGKESTLWWSVRVCERMQRMCAVNVCNECVQCESVKWQNHTSSPLVSIKRCFHLIQGCRCIVRIWPSLLRFIMPVAPGMTAAAAPIPCGCIL
jgi:hypothetical protein